MVVDWLKELNESQRQAVTHGDGPLLIVAGAGTGKTKTLACRVAYLIAQGVSPDRILLLTFTRRAAAEMLNRAERLIGEREGGAAGRVWGGTFHAVASRLLRVYGTAIGLRSDFTVMDPADAGDMMNLIRNELKLPKGERRLARKQTLVAIYSRAVNAREGLAETLSRHFPWCQDDEEAICSIFEQYVERKRQRNVLDYDDLLLFWKALADTPGAGEAVAGRFDHILVDEYQDTNAVQAEILRAMRKSAPNISAVGDDAQAIYSFRAATVRNILDFPEHFPGSRVVTLEQNYRSTRPILNASNAVMAFAAERYTKELWSENQQGDKPLLVHCLDEPNQCAVVCRNILEHLEAGVPLRRQAVLFRAGHHSDQLEVELSRRNIPFVKYGGLKFVEAAHVKDLLAFLRIVENPHDEISWFRVLLLLPGIGQRSARRVLEVLGVGHPAGDAIETSTVVTPLHRLLADPPGVPPAARESFEHLREALAACCGWMMAESDRPGKPGKDPPVAVQVELVRRFYEPIFQQIYDNPGSRVRDLEQLEQIAGGYRSRERFITDLTIDPPSSSSDYAGPPFLEEDYLTLSTIHSAKGCEWNVVHIIHAADGMIPSDMALEDEAGLEEERRLLYVAMTRAKNHLYVYFPLRYYFVRGRRGDGHSYAKLTRFLPPKLVADCFRQRGAFVDNVTDAPAAVSGASQIDSWLKGLWRQ